jgi:hypothetical protein
MALNLSKYILLDNHAHSLLKDHENVDNMSLRSCFTESRSQEMIAEHVPHSLHYADMVSRLGRLIDAKGEDEILAKRRTVYGTQYVKRLWDNVSIGGLIIDDGLLVDSMMSLSQLQETCGRPVFRCRRIETVLESCIKTAVTFEELEQQLNDAVFDTKRGGVVALKTIMAYRGGLELDIVDRADAVSEFANVKSEFDKGNGRIERRPLYHYLLLKIFEAAGKQGLPVQMHVGLGDDDALIVKANPALFQPALKLPALQKTKFVLLHCYPYVREAAMLCSIYANVYMDLSLTMNLIVARGSDLITEALATAPPTKLLAGTDGHSCPETHWYGAMWWKFALHRALTQLIENFVMHEKQADDIAAGILHENAKRLYALEGLA